MARKQGTAPSAAASASADASPSAAAPGRRDGEIGHELRTASASTEPQEIGARSHNVRFDLTVDIAYHAIRELFFARLNRFLTGLQVLLGTTAVAALVSWFPDAAVWLVAVSALAGVMLLIIDPAGAARDHRAFRSRLHMIRADLEEFDPSDKDLRAARARMIRVAADAPPGYRGIQAIAYNNAVNALYPPDRASDHRYRISIFRGLFANWLPMRGHQFPKEIS